MPSFLQKIHPNHETGATAGRQPAAFPACSWAGTKETGKNYPLALTAWILFIQQPPVRSCLPFAATRELIYFTM